MPVPNEIPIRFEERGKRPEPSRIEIESAASDAGILSFRHPVEVLIFDEAEGWRLEASEFGSVCFGETEREALDGLHEDLCVLWQAIGLAPDEDLTPGALAIKRKLVAAVESYSIG